VPGLPAVPVGATKRSLVDAPEDEPEELDEELLLLLEDEELLEEDDELDDEELEEDEELELDDEPEDDEELEEDEPPDDGPNAATDRTRRLPAEDVQLAVFVPRFATRDEPAPLLLEFGLSKRSVCPAPGVNEAFDAPLPTTSISHEPVFGTPILADMAVPDAALLVAAASGPRWATPVRETAPAESPLTVPAVVTWTL
jgi:hypothetical protein